MSRVTPPVKKALRSTTRPLTTQTRLRVHSTLLQNQLVTLEDTDLLTGNDAILSRAHSTLNTPSTRPQLQATKAANFRPLMQGFKTSAPKPAAHDASTIDFMYFPSMQFSSSTDPVYKLRVPVMPDSYDVDRSEGSGLETETLDEAIAGPQILVVAAEPERVSAMTEVVGNEAYSTVDNVVVTMADVGREVESVTPERGMLRDLWAGMVEDVFGQNQVTSPAKRRQ